MEEYGKSGRVPTVFSSLTFLIVGNGAMKTQMAAKGAMFVQMSTNMGEGTGRKAVGVAAEAI